LGWLAPLAAPAQDRTQTLADIRQELTVLYVELQRIGTELNTTGAVQVPLGAGTTLDRVNGLEAEITRLTGKIEELEFRILSLVRTAPTGLAISSSGSASWSPIATSRALATRRHWAAATFRRWRCRPRRFCRKTRALPRSAVAAALAVAEQADFDAAMAAFEAGDLATAADDFARFAETYPGGPLTGDAQFMAGEALAQQGQVVEAGRAYLAAYTAVPAGQYTTLAV
jgi:TolA-binding protein